MAESTLSDPFWWTCFRRACALMSHAKGSAWRLRDVGLYTSGSTAHHAVLPMTRFAPKFLFMMLPRAREHLLSCPRYNTSLFLWTYLFFQRFLDIYLANGEAAPKIGIERLVIPTMTRKSCARSTDFAERFVSSRHRISRYRSDEYLLIRDVSPHFFVSEKAYTVM